MKRATSIYGVALIALLAMAWMRWTADPEIDLEGQVVLLQGDAESIDTIRWKSEDNEATITRRADDHGTFFWVEYTRWKDPPPVEAFVGTDPTSDDTGIAEDTGTEETPPEPERIATRSVFKAAAKADALVKSLSPMLALRRLEITDESKIEDIGLAEPEGSVEIDRGGRTQRVEIGGEAYGTRDRYVRLPETGAIYLVKRELLQPLKYARTRLPDRSLFSMERADIATGHLVREKSSVDFEQRFGDDERRATWVRTDRPEETAEQLATWMGKALKLKGTRYADPEAPPTDLQVRFSISLTTTSSTTENLEVLQVGDDGDWYGRSEHTRGLVKLVRSAARGLSDDVDAVIGSD